jgi:hypothetical protein
MKNLYFSLMFICLTVFFFRIKNLGKGLMLLGPLLICSIAVELWTDYNKNGVGIEDWYQYHIYQPIEYILLTLIFYNNIRSAFVKKAMLASIPFFLTTLSIYYFFQPNSFNSEKFIDFQIESFFLIVWAILYLIEIVNTDAVIDSIFRLPVFWLSFAVLLFYAGNIFIVGFRDFLAKYDVEMRDTLMYVPRYLNLVFYLMIIVGLLCTRTRKKSSSV